MQIVYYPRFNLNHMPMKKENQNSNEVELFLFWTVMFEDAEHMYEVDYEDWVEDAIQLKEAVAIANKTDNSIHIYSKTGIIDLEVEFNKEDEYILIGQVATVVQQNGYYRDNILDRLKCRSPKAEEIRLSGNYQNNQNFLNHINREFELVDMEYKEFNKKFKEMHERGHEKLYLKISIQKYLNKIIEADEKGFHVPDNLELALCHLEGMKNGLMVQEYIPMMYEYRIVVVGRNPVAGAGCIEEFTPMQNNGERFNYLVRKERNSSDEIENRNDIVNSYIEFAKKYAEKDPYENYILDLCMVKKNNELEIEVVEINPFLNYGMYAINYNFVLDATLKEIEK